MTRPPAASNKRVILVSGLIAPQPVVKTIREHFPGLRDRVPEGDAKQILAPGVDPTGWDTSRGEEVFGPGWRYVGLEEGVVDTVRSLLELEGKWAEWGSMRWNRGFDRSGES